MRNRRIDEVRPLPLGGLPFFALSNCFRLPLPAGPLPQDPSASPFTAPSLPQANLETSDYRTRYHCSCDSETSPTAVPADCYCGTETRLPRGCRCGTDRGSGGHRGASRSGGTAPGCRYGRPMRALSAVAPPPSRVRRDCCCGRRCASRPDPLVAPKGQADAKSRHCDHLAQRLDQHKCRPT